MFLYGNGFYKILKNSVKKKSQFPTKKELERYDNYKEVNRAQCSLTYKNWLTNNKERRKLFEKTYTLKNRSLDLQKKRLTFWRQKQQQLADAQLKNNEYNTSLIRF